MRMPPWPDCDLPPALQNLIAQVVRRTRLWTREKKDVLAELKSHFRDGLAALEREGQTGEPAVATLSEQFGSPRVAAKLIRRAKKRNRPLAWKVFAGISRALVCTLIAFALYVGWMFTGRAKPSVDYVARVNARIDEMPESQRSWPILRQVMIDFKPFPKELGNETREGMELKPSDPKWQELKAWVDSNRQLVPEIRRAAQRPYLGFRYDNTESQRFQYEVWKRHPEQAPDSYATSQPFQAAMEDPAAPRMIGLLIPYLIDSRTLCRFMVLDARIRAGEGDWAGAWASIDAAHRLGYQMLTQSTVIEQLVAVACINLALEEASRVLEKQRPSLTSEKLKQLGAMHVFAASADAIRMNTAFEREGFEDIVQYVFTDNGRGDGHLLPRQINRIWTWSDAPTFLPALAIVHAGRRATLAKYDQLWDEAAKILSLPLYDPRRAQADATVVRMKKDRVEGTRYALICMLMPTFSRCDELARQAMMRQQAARTTLAILGYRAEHGRFPDRLDALRGKDIPSAPIDVYSGDLLRYRVVGDDFLLYSVGENLKDDGGVAHAPASTAPGDEVTLPADHLPDRSGRNKYDIDIVLWPADQTG